MSAGEHVRTALVRPFDLEPGDVLADGDGVTVTEVVLGPDGVWVEFSDGGCGFLDRPLRVIRD